MFNAIFNYSGWAQASFSDRWFDVRRVSDGTLFSGGYFDLPVSMNGEADASVACSINACGLAAASGSLTANGFGFGDSAGSPLGGGTVATPLNNSTILKINIVNGIGVLSATLRGDVSCSGGGFSSVGCAADVKLNNSVYFGGLLAFEADGTPVPLSDLIINTESGYDYSIPIDPSSTAVPEPSSLVLLGTGLSGIAFAAYRRKKAYRRSGCLG